MEYNEVMDFLKLKEKADKRAEEVFNLLCELKEFNVSWFMNLSGITYEDGSIWFECSSCCMNEYDEYDEDHFGCDIEYLYMSDEEITKQIKDKQEKERKETEKREKEKARRIAETKEKHDRAEYERLKKKYEK